MLFNLLRCPLAVEQECAAGLYIVDNLISLNYIGGIMACDEIGLCDIVRAFNGLVSESQVRDRHAARLFGVILEISLYEFFGMIADDFY
ncbi:hypothetical protein SDC9_195821 [bioreactor metagenome]|uniref:Uncharacterized protein n=1 Tax=bioreactor metagenome TaxID=1076179 RepID=A0A645IBB5_9ZZZZ